MGKLLRSGGGTLRFLLTVGFCAGCRQSQPPLVPTSPPVVMVSEPVTQEITDYESFTGRTEAAKTIEIRARVDGYLQKVHFKEGNEVEKDDLLFEIDPRPYEAELAKAQAAVVQAEAHFKRLESDYRRALTLLNKRVISPEEFDKTAGDRAEAEAAVGVSKASRRLAELNLGYCKVKAPISGRISRQLIDPGNLVKADVTPLTSIVSLDPMYVYFDVDERTMLQLRRLIREGKMKSSREAEVPVRMGLLDEAPRFPHQGAINFVDNKVDPGTGTLRVRGVFPNPKNPELPKNTTRILSPGLFARVQVRIGTPYKALLISERALGTDQGQKFLYVVDRQNEVVYRRVKTGPLNNGLRVIEDGLKPGERVIVSGLQRVRPGAKVEPKVVPLQAEEVATTTTPVTVNSGSSGGSQSLGK